MEQDKNTPDLEKFVRGQLDSLRPEPDADTWSKIAGQQAPLNRRLRLRFYGIRLVLLTGVLVAAWAIWQYATAEPASIPVPKVESDRMYAGAASAPDFGQTLPTDVTTRAGVPFSGNHVRRPDWYRTNTVPGETARFTAEQGIRYQSPVSGNKVHIPGGVLVYADGSPVTGPVDLMFREYRTVADFLAAGMPMHYSDNRGTFFFNSGGMFEVRVSQNGADLFVASGKNYEVDFAPTADLRDASLFYLPDSSNQWGHIAPDSDFFSEPEAGHGIAVERNAAGMPRILGEPDVVADMQRNFTISCIPDMWSVPDTADAVAWLQESIVTGREYAYGKLTPPLWFRKNSGKADAFFLWALERSNIRIVHEIDLDSRFFPDDLENVFTELSAFKGYYFIRQTDSTDALWRPDPQNSVDQIFSQPRTWKKVTVYPQENAKCLVVFGDEKEQISIPARLCRSNDRNPSTSFNPTAVFAEYERLRNVRHRNIVDQMHRWRQFIALSDIWQRPKEWCMPVNAWFDYFDGHKKMMQYRYDSLYQTGIVTDRTLAAEVIQKWKSEIRQLHFKNIAQQQKNANKMQQMAMTLRLTGFGTHNWDQIFQVAAQIRYMEPRYKTLAGTTITPKQTRIVDRERNLFFSMPESASLLNVPGRNMDVIVTAADGRVYYLPGKTYAGLTLENKKDFTFQMEDVTDRVGSPKEWAALLGI